MQYKKGQLVELDVHTIAFGGRGMGKFEGVSVFVDGAVVGDRVSAELTRIKPKFMEARLVEVLKESPDRIKPRCPYADVCGGCHFQHLDYAKQLEVKRQHTVDAFERIGKIYESNVAEVIPCDDPYFYRNKMEFSFGYDADMKFALGLHLPGRRYDILDLKECYLESELSNEILGVVRGFCVKRGWDPRRYMDETGFLKSLFIREGKRTGEVMVNLMTTDDFPEDFEEGMKELSDKLVELGSEDKRVTSVYWSVKIAKRGIPTRTEEHLIYGRHTLHEKMILDNGDELDFEILPQAFFQVNTFQAEKLYSQVVKLASEDEHTIAFDLFCGTGTIGLFLARHCEEVLGIDLNEDSIKMARENAQKNGIFDINFFTGDVSTVLKNVRQRPSLVVVDPPRAGLTEALIKKINDFDARKIVYVSCNPSTLARDCSHFSQFGYKLISAQPVDMFPHSYHIENVCLLER